MSLATRSHDQCVESTVALLDDVFGTIEPRDFAVRLWEGTMWGPGAGQRARFTIVLKHPGALRSMLMPPIELSAGEAYIYDDVDIEGDVEAIAEAGERLRILENDAAALSRLALRLLGLPREAGGYCERRARLKGRVHTKERDRAAILHHYDVSNDFYALWLDTDMVYSCAYFESPDEDLDAAQRRKLDYICSKLRLQPEERLLDIGCGWGALAIHAAREYGADVTGITLSTAQASLARQRIADAGLANRCRVEVRDYREVDESRPFDKLVSVGMFEHVGEAMLPEYFGRAERLLKVGGTFLNHGISREKGSGPLKKDGFLGTYVFPDGELTPISVTLARAEEAGFEVRDVESLREHYALTLRQWVRRLEKNADDARAYTDDITYRIWRLYMAFSAYNFSRGSIGVYQTLLSKHDSGDTGLPLTRKDWYSRTAPE